MTAPFVYPAVPHVRRHGPRGYAEFASYRPFLRDDFAVRCVYCLRREAWGRVFGEFAIDHFVPVKYRPDRASDYTNLLYVCGPCNLKKGQRFIADPLAHLLSDRLLVRSNGTVEARTRECRQIVGRSLVRASFRKLQRVAIDRRTARTARPVARY